MSDVTSLAYKSTGARERERERDLMTICSQSHEDEKLAELKAFDGTKAGVKGIVDAGLDTIPAIFLTPAAEKDADDNLPDSAAPPPESLEIPVIDISASDAAHKVRHAAETWGFFQVLGHGVPAEVLEEMLNGVRRFNEQDPNQKASFYVRDDARSLWFNSTFDLYQSRRANWRDSLFCTIAPVSVPPEQIPATCREIIVEYSKHVAKLGEALLELLSEALGLHRSYLKELECDKGQLLLCHYYPPCPQPELTLGLSSHSDAGFITVLLQNDIGGLQVRYRGRWVDVQPVPGALVINIGDLMKLITNDRFQSVEHRVLASLRGPRISVGTFFTTYNSSDSDRIYGPIEELLSEDKPPRFRKTSVKEFSEFFVSKGLAEKDRLAHFRL